MKITFAGAEYDCAKAMKTADSATLYLTEGGTVEVAGISDFGAFTLEGGEWESSAPSAIDVLGQQVAQLTLSNMQKDQVIDALGAQLAQTTLDVMALKSAEEGGV